MTKVARSRTVVWPWS